MKSCVVRILPAAIAMAMGGAAGVAHGSGFQLMEQNASGLGNAYAGQAAAAENASTIFWNPAGMTRLPGMQATGAVNLIRPKSEFSNSGSAPPTPLNPLGGNGGDAGDLAVVPNTYFSWQLAPRWWVGIGVTVPFGLKTDYDPDWIGRFQSRTAEIKTIDVNPSVAFKLSDAVSIGGGISYQKGHVKFQRSTLLGAPFPAGTEGKIDLNIDDDAWGWNVGAMFSMGQATRIGLTYRSEIEYDLEGPLKVFGPGGVLVAAPSSRLTAELPATVSLGVAHQINPQWELLGDVTWTRWSSIKSLPLIATSASAVGPTGATLDTFNFQFRDTYRAGLGANWSWRGDTTVKFGIAYDKSPVTDTFRTATLPDADRFWLAIGVKYRVSKQATLDVGYAHIMIDDPVIAMRRNGEVPPRGNVVGEYDSSVNILSAQFTYSF
jgi:long-chain fatty acid transport protein